MGAEEETQQKISGAREGLTKKQDKQKRGGTKEKMKQWKRSTVEHGQAHKEENSKETTKKTGSQTKIIIIVSLRMGVTIDIRLATLPGIMVKI